MNMTSQAKLSLCFLNNLQGLTKKEKKKENELKKALVSHMRCFLIKPNIWTMTFFFYHFSLYTIKMDQKNKIQFKCGLRFDLKDFRNM